MPCMILLDFCCIILHCKWCLLRFVSSTKPLHADTHVPPFINMKVCGRQFIISTHVLFVMFIYALVCYKLTMK